MLVASQGPTTQMASAPGRGLRVGPVWRVQQRPEGGAARIHAGFAVQPNTVFDLALFPDLQHDSTSDESAPPNFDGTRFGVRFELDDGAVVTLRDQHDHAVDGKQFGARGSCLVGDNWNLLRLDLTPLAGRRIVCVLLTNEPRQNGAAWLQVFGPADAPVEADDVVERVDTRRGTHSAFLYSRGNTLPLTCVPHGFNFLTPATNARDPSWLYGWHRDGGPTPRLQGLAFTHEPSPWIGDRSAFQVMPWVGGACDPAGRSLAFDHDRETARPHRYAVDLDGGVRAEMTATSRAAVFRFTFAQAGPRGVVLDQQIEAGSVTVSRTPDGRACFEAAVPPQPGWSTRLERPFPPAYVYGEFSVPGRPRVVRERRSPFATTVIAGRRLVNSWVGRHLTMRLRRPQAVLVEVDDDVVELRVAMSFISCEQARRSLANEVADDDYDQVETRAHDAWANLLGRLEIDGGTLDQRQSAWSNLARLYCWPNEHHENLGSAETPSWAYASPYRPAQEHGRSHTGCQIVPGPLYVNNGYWDTVRTAWPAYHLLTPERAPDLLDGILQQARDGGWMGRWVAPGYVDCMVGTNSDQIFADAIERGIALDELTAYDTALRNATTPSDSPLTGRKSIGRARFVGHVDTDEPEGLSWSMENAQCDAAIARWSASLVERAERGEIDTSRLDEYRSNAVWFANRALSHSVLFDHRIGFYQGRTPDGSWRVAEAADFDPAVWGYDYTETSAWGQAFHAQHDGATLARLLGGEHRLSAKLDELLRTPAITRPSMYGSYDYNTQEMNEAQAAGLGQLAISNQPAHHIPFMYLFAGRPDRTQWLTRELLDSQFVGSEIGQGYPGDEDNGEMSAWWLFAASGLYPLFPGGPEMVVTAPLFSRLAWTRADGTRLEVNATGVEHRYIQSMRLNGQPWDAVSIPSRLLQGDVRIDVQLGPEPSDWGRQSRPWSASTASGQVRHWTPDHTSSATIDGPASLVDDRGETVTELAVGESVTLSWPEPVHTGCLTLTSADAGQLALLVEVRADGAWRDAGVRPRASRWPHQTQAYSLASTFDAIRFTATGKAQLTQIEVYAAPEGAD